MLCVAYAYAFWHDLAPYWFNPNWTTDDALQQTYPFYKALYHDLFAGDLITKMMECYLEPLHYGISYTLTLMTKNPIMTGHWVTLIQISATCGLLFLTVRKRAGLVPAFFSVAWLLHTRLMMQRITGGLPRGWAAPIFAAYFLFELSGIENGVLILIFIGCMLHAPATLVIALSHGLYLLWQTIRPNTRLRFRRRLILYCVLSPFYAMLALAMVRMPTYIGSMANISVASAMPEFQNPGGRFPFLPFPSFLESLRMYGFDPFLSRLHRSVPLISQGMPAIVIGLAVLLFVVGKIQRTTVIPTPMYLFIAASISVYLLSELLAFRLYVPNRHLQFPLAMCEIELFSIGIWRACRTSAGTNSPSQRSATQKFADTHNILGIATLGCLGILIYLGAGDGLEGAANYNWERGKHGGAFEWIRHNTPQRAVIAGEPSFIDPVQLFGMRVGYVTTETAHPFYNRYYAEMSRRLTISLRAHYAGTMQELSDTLAPEGVDYFVFDRARFTRSAIEKDTYFKPFDTALREEIERNASHFAFDDLKTLANSPHFAPVVYQDHQALVIDLRKLKEYLDRTRGK